MSKISPFESILHFGLVPPVPDGNDHPRVRIETTMGDITIELDRTKAPRTVENFLSYAASGFYEGTIFHRVIKGFMIQGGGLTEDMDQKSTNAPVGNEADNALKNLKGTIAMARTQDPHSATSQFFINAVDNHFLDFTAKTAGGWGYCVFGRVVEGISVVEVIENMPTTSRGMYRDVPATPVVINRTVLVREGSSKG